MDKNILVCECGSTEHQIVIYHDVEEKEVYCHIHLSDVPFFKRLIRGIRYIFGYKCKYGHWDEFIFNKKDADKVLEIYKTLS